MEKHVLLFRETKVIDVYASSSNQRAGRIAIGAQYYNPKTCSYCKVLECVMPSIDKEGADFEFGRTIDKCLSAGYSLWPSAN